MPKIFCSFLSTSRIDGETTFKKNLNTSLNKQHTQSSLTELTGWTMPIVHIIFKLKYSFIISAYMCLTEILQCEREWNKILLDARQKSNQKKRLFFQWFAFCHNDTVVCYIAVDMVNNRCQHQYKRATFHIKAISIFFAKWRNINIEFYRQRSTIDIWFISFIDSNKKNGVFQYIDLAIAWRFFSLHFFHFIESLSTRWKPANLILRFCFLFFVFVCAFFSPSLFVPLSIALSHSLPLSLSPFPSFHLITFKNWKQKNPFCPWIAFRNNPVAKKRHKFRRILLALLSRCLSYL